MDVMTATDKWCPAQHATAVAIIAAGGAYEDADDRSRCVANDCMAWRYFKDSKTDGYCGLAGKPNG